MINFLFLQTKVQQGWCIFLLNEAFSEDMQESRVNWKILTIFLVKL